MGTQGMVEGGLGLMHTPQKTEPREGGQLATPGGIEQFVEDDGEFGESGGQLGGYRRQLGEDEGPLGGGVGQLCGGVVGQLDDQLVTPVRGTCMASEDSLVTPDCNVLSSPARTG